MQVKYKFIYSIILAITCISSSVSAQTEMAYRLVKDINPNAEHSRPSRTTVLNNALYFKATDGVHGAEIWKSDGTPDGTIMLKDIYTGSSSSDANELTLVDGSIYFNASDGTNNGLWRTNGAPGNATFVAEAPQGMPLYNLTEYGNTLYFTADDGHTGTVNHGRELWKYNGTSIEMVKDILPGTGWDQAGYQGPRNLTVFENRLYFNADEGNSLSGRELWKSDGTSGGTVLVKDIYPGAGNNSNPDNLTVFGDRLYFSASDTASNRAFWKTNGDANGTEKIKDISISGDIVTMANMMYFVARTASGTDWALWKSNGKTDGTVIVKGFDNGLGNLVAGTNRLYFVGDDGTGKGMELWTSDGFSAGTNIVKDIRPGSYSSNIRHLTFLNDLLFFSAKPYSDEELWKSDGTEAGTKLAKNINPGGSSIPDSPYMIAYDNSLFFSANDGTHGYELWMARENSAPVLNGSTIEFRDGETAVGQIKASDADSDSIVFTLHSGVDQAHFNLTVDGVLSFLSAPNINNPTDFDGDNRYEIDIRLDDGFVSTTYAVTVLPSDCTFFIVPAENAGTAVICL